MAEPLCQFIYNGHTGPNGKVCNRTEVDHCPQKYSEHYCEKKLRKVHHPFQRTFKCPTCGSTTKPEVKERSNG